MGRDDWGYGADTIGAIDAWAEDYPGFDGLGLSWAKPYKANSPSERVTWTCTDPYIYHFPDGCAGVARLLVRALVPEALRGRTMEDQVLEHLDYARLDQTGSRVRIRLGCPVIRVRHDGDVDSAGEVEVAYVQGGRARSVRAKGAIMACGSSMVPYVVDGLPEPAEAGVSVHDPDAARFRQRPTSPAVRVQEAQDLGRASGQPGLAVGRLLARLPGEHGRLRLPDRPRRRGPDSHVRHVLQTWLFAA